MIQAWIALLLLPLTLRAATLEWDTDAGADSFRVYVGLASHNYEAIFDVPSPSFALTNLTPGRTLFFTVTALNKLGLESPPSNEVSYQAPMVSTNSISTTNSILTIYSAGDPVGPWVKEVAVTNLFAGRKFFKWTLGFETNK